MGNRSQIGGSGFSQGSSAVLRKGIRAASKVCICSGVGVQELFHLSTVFAGKMTVVFSSKAVTDSGIGVAVVPTSTFDVGVVAPSPLLLQLIKRIMSGIEAIVLKNADKVFIFSSK